MKKLINIKNKQKLTESSIKVGDVNYSNRLRKRLVDTARALELAKEALKKAEQNGQTSLAAQLKARIAELEDLLANYNVDKIQQDSPSGNKGQDSPASSDRSKQSDTDQESDTDTDEKDSDESDEDEDSQNNKDSGEETGDSETESEDSGNEEESDEEDDSESESQKNKQSDEDSGENEDDSDDDSEDEGDDEGAEGASDKDSNSDGEEETDEDSDSEKDLNQDSESEEEDSEGDGTEDESSSGSEGEENSKSKSKSKNQNKSDDNDDEEQESDKSKSKLSLDDNDSNGSGDDDDPIINPFADEEDVQSMPLQMNGKGGKPPREATVDETLELLKTLTGEGKLGAIDALKELIAKRKAAANESLMASSRKSLTEAVKGLRDMTDDEFGDYINDTYDLIDQVDPVTYIDDMDDRAARIKDWSSDPLSIQELQAEDNVELQKDRQKVKARDAAKARYNNYGSLRDFEMNFYSAINNQVEDIRVEYQSYDEINAEYESEDAIMKADIVKELPNEAKPIIEVFFDQSGSWDKRDVLVGRKAIKSIKTFEDMGEIVLMLRFFDDVVTADEDDPRLGQGGTNAWPEILQEIKASGAKNVVIMTDHDMNWDAVRYGQTCRVEGCVWWIWKNGIAAPDCTKHLIGEKGNYQFAFNSSTEDVDDEQV